MRAHSRTLGLGFAALVAVAAFAGGTASGQRQPAGASALLAVADRLLPALDAAGEAAAGGLGGPEAVQRQYDAARDLAQALAAVGAVPDACASLATALRAYARGEIAQAEGVDRPSQQLTKAGMAAARQARAHVSAARAGCRPGPFSVPLAGPPQLDEPRDGEAFSGLVKMAVPAAVARVELLVDGRFWDSWGATTGSFAVKLVSPPGHLHTIELRFSSATGARVGRAVSHELWLLPKSSAELPGTRREDAKLSVSLHALARGFPGYSATWVEDLRSGRSGAWNADARFPAASLVKLGVLYAALRRYPRPEHSPLSYDLAALTGWSSNLAANRLLVELGGSESAGAALVTATLHALGASASTYPGDYRVGTVHRRVQPQNQPPLVSSRTTSAHDMATLLYLLDAAAAGDRGALVQARLSRHQARVGLAWLLSSQPRGENVGLFRGALGRGVPAAQKQGWLSDARHSAALVYLPSGPKLVVLLTYRGGGIALADAKRYGAAVVALARRS